MDEEIKKGLKEIAKKAETRMAKSILLWKYKKEGKEIPREKEIQRESAEFMDRANRVISKRGKHFSIFPPFSKKCFCLSIRSYKNFNFLILFF